MKKILLPIMMIITCASGYGYTTCMRNNTYMAVFRPSVNGTPTFDATNKVWKVVYDYITLTGYASCNDISGTANTPKTNLVTGSQDTGTHCWCQMWPIEDYGYETGPSGYWMYLQSFNTDVACADSSSGCAYACANAMANNTTFRTAVFEAMW